MERQTDQIGVLSIETGARLLTAMAALGPQAKLKELAQAAQMPPAKAHRYVVSFTRIGLMEQDHGTGRYGFGPMAFHIGAAALRSQTIWRLAPSELAALRALLNQTVALSVWGTFGPTFVQVEEATIPVHLSIRPGTVVPLMTSASGRIFVAYQDPQLVQPVLAKEKASKLSAPNLEGSFESEEVEQIREEVRRRGFASVQGRIYSAVSAPVFDHQGKLVASVVALGAATALDVSDGSSAQVGVCATARRLSKMLAPLSP